jgi:iron complex outermembrane receptor protein
MLIGLVGLYAQEKSITGTVTDTDGEPLPGVSISVDGTTQGTITDLEGNYTITDVAQEQVLVYSFVGYLKERRQVGDQSNINVELMEDITELGEVLVIGYGVQKKSDKTGAVATVSSEDMNQGVITDPIHAMQGKSAGVLISKKGGDPNAGFSVKIRGAAGFESGTTPLYVVDGVPGVDPTTIAPEDIETFTILKDAASTAIYGSQGSNGVILITTKKGTAGVSKVQFNAKVSADQVANTLDLLTASELRTFVDNNDLNFSDGGGNTDWQDEIYRTGITQSYNLNFSGGSENSTYYASITQADWQGVMKGTEKERTTAKINLTHKTWDGRLKLAGSLSGAFEQNDYENYSGFDKDDVIYQALQRNPTDPVYTAENEYYIINRAFNYDNPIAVINEIENLRDAKRFFGSFNADLEIFDGFIATTNIGYTRDDNESSYFRYKDGIYSSADNGAGRKEYNNSSKKLIEVYANYTKSLNAHYLNAMAGYSWEENNYNGFFSYAENPQSPHLSYNNLGSFVDYQKDPIGSWKGMSRLIGFFGRVQYNYDERIYGSASIRRDGSTKFGKNNKWGTFPTFAAGWNIHKESFLDNLDLFSQLKLRASYGVSGNQAIGEYFAQILPQDTGEGTNPESGEQVTVFGFSNSWNANPDLKWESTTEINIGLDFGFVGNRINGSVELYTKETEDILAPVQVPSPPALANFTWENIGKMNNTGIELFLEFFVVNRPNISWKSTLNGSHYKTIITELGKWVEEGDYRKEGYLSGRGLVGEENYVVGNIEGEELGAFFLPVYVGLSSDGRLLYESETGGITRNLSDAERQIVGSPAPDLEIGWSNSFTLYNNWTIDFSLRSMIGNDVYNATQMFFDYPGNLPSLNAVPEAVEWYEQGRTNPPQIADIYVEDGSFVKLDYLSLGYNFEFNSSYFSSVRIYVTGNNLFTLTNYSGVDPETSVEGRAFGIDQYDVYPKTRSISIGMSSTFK